MSFAIYILELLSQCLGGTASKASKVRPRHLVYLGGRRRSGVGRRAGWASNQLRGGGGGNLWRRPGGRLAPDAPRRPRHVQHGRRARHRVRRALLRRGGGGGRRHDERWRSGRGSPGAPSADVRVPPGGVPPAGGAAPAALHDGGRKTAIRCSR